MSLTDIKIIALTYTLEKEVNGNTDHIPTEPAQKPLPTAPKPSMNFFNPVQNNTLLKNSSNKAWGVGNFGEGDDNEGWITPDNVTEYTAAYNVLVGTVKPDDSVHVACITTDFVMQNVILQMKMNLLSIAGMVIKSTQKWILHCYGCHKLCKEIEKKFCPHCGHPTFEKVSYTIDEDGNPTYNIPTGKRSLRGTKYPLPLPKGGRNNNEIILYEQQLPKKPKKRRDVDLMDPNRQFLQDRSWQSKSTVVGFGKKNPNEARKNFGKNNKSKRRM